MNLLKKKMKASITVEAAFVVPIVLLVIIALIYFTFYLHDRVHLEEVIERGLGQGNLMVTNRSRLDGKPVDYGGCNSSKNWSYLKVFYDTEETRIKEYLEKELEQGFFFLTKERVSCEVNGFSIEIRITMKGKNSINPAGNLWTLNPGVTLERSVPIHNPEEILRSYGGV